jgi:LPS-assembly lipoprotein
MSSSDRRTLLFALVAALPLAACGYAPVYAPGSAAMDLRGAVLTDAPGDRSAFAFVGQIENRFGRPETPRFGLSYTISVRRIDLALTTEGAILRYNLIGRVSYKMTDLKSGAALTSGQVEDFTGFGATKATIAAQAAEDDALERLMVILADQVSTRLIATAASWVPAQAGP